MNKLVNMIPDFIKPVLRPIYYGYRRLRAAIRRHRTIGDTLSYWRQPDDGHNLPSSYLSALAAHSRSQCLVKVVNKYANPEAKILEPGCNVGRNLNYLFEAGFRKLEGIEISKDAVELLNKSYPEMARHITIHNKSIEEIVRGLEDDTYDIVFTMAVLQHIHTKSEWIFPEIVRITRSFLVTVEGEGYISWRHFPRNYKKVFEPLGMKQIEVIEDTGFFARVFRKEKH